MRDESRTMPVLPVSLLVGGRRCLVVGGGPVAARKVGHLLHAGADVRVVSPEAVGTIRALARRRRIRHEARPFRARDVEGCRVVFAATDDPAVNSRVIRSCRRRGVLCGAADAQWPDGDFLSPAVCRRAGVVVTVSTGGRSCRLARRLKDRLGSLLDALVAEAQRDGPPTP